MTTGAEAKRKRVLSGMRPTGKLHIGHYFGALQNWVRLQNDATYECFYFIADWHALTSDYADPSAVAQNTIEIVTDYLAAGIDPAKSVVFLQSAVPEHAELHLLLSMVTPLGWLERVPTYKEALENITDKDLHNYGFLGYPVLQCADIVIYGEEGAPLFIPVGEDQVSHVEVSREIVRRFNGFYSVSLKREAILSKRNPDLLIKMRTKFASEGGIKLPEFPWKNPLKPDEVPAAELESHKQYLREATLQIVESGVRKGISEAGLQNFINNNEELVPFLRVEEILIEPDAMLTKTPRIPGLDGRKMSKSYGNAITLSESDADIRSKTKVMKTDPARQRRTDPGNPDVCPVYDWHKLFSTPETLEWAATGCRTAGIGCIECKAKMADGLIQWIDPVRERRVEYEKHPKRVLEIMDAGSAKARTVAQGTMKRVREAVFGWEKKRKEISNQ